MEFPPSGQFTLGQTGVYEPPCYRCDSTMTVVTWIEVDPEDREMPFEQMFRPDLRSLTCNNMLCPTNTI